MLYKMVDLDEPAQYVGVYVLRWGRDYEPSVAFREATEEEVKAEADKVSGWQSMDTAPDDGTTILVSDGVDVFMASWDFDRDFPKLNDNKCWISLTGYDSEWGTYSIINPIAWMPLPEPFKKEG